MLMKIFKIENRGLDKIITILNKEFVLKNYKLKQYIKKIRKNNRAVISKENL